MLFIIILAAALANETLADNQLFLKKNEQKAIDEALRIKEERAASSNSLHLQGVVYVDDNNWTLWINGKAYHNELPKELNSLQLVSVSSDGLKLSKSGVVYNLNVGGKISSK